MRPEKYSDNPAKSFIRQAKDYEAAGIEPNMQLIVPFTDDDTRESIEEKGVNWAGLMRQINSVFAENIGNALGSKVRNSVSKGETLPTQDDLDEIIAKYDFSGARMRATTEESMSQEDRVFFNVLRTRLKALLRTGTFSADNESKITVQTKKEADRKELPAGKIPTTTYEELVQAAIDGADATVEDRTYTFGGDPEFEFDDDGNILFYKNLSAVVAHCDEMAKAKLAEMKRVSSVKARIPTQ